MLANKAIVDFPTEALSKRGIAVSLMSINLVASRQIGTIFALFDLY